MQPGESPLRLFTMKHMKEMKKVNAFFMLFMSFMVITQFVVGIYWMRIPTRKNTNGKTNT